MSVVMWMQDIEDLDDADLSGQFYRHFRLLSGILTASGDACDRLGRRFYLSDDEIERFHVIPPASRSLPEVDADPPADLGAADETITTVATSASHIHSDMIDRILALAALYDANVQFVVLLEQPLSPARRYAYFPANVVIVHAGSAEGWAHLQQADIWLSATSEAFLEMIQYAADRGLAIVAPEAACAAAGVPAHLCWCARQAASEQSALDGDSGLAEALSAALTQPQARAQRAQILAQDSSRHERRARHQQALSQAVSSIMRRAHEKTPPNEITSRGSVSAADITEARGTIDLTIALTSHAEVYEAGPMFASLLDAIGVCTKRGIQTEVIIGFDSASEENKRFFANALKTKNITATCVSYDFRDQGKTRNALASQARGQFFAVIDADDLISENWLADAVAALQSCAQSGVDAIAHPELNWQFDGVVQAYSNPAQDDPLFSVHAMAIANYYDAMCVAPTRLWHALPYADRDLVNGFAFEDYQWFVEATALGWRHIVVPDTIIFKRRRDASQHRNSQRAKALIRAIEPLAIDNLRILGEGL